MLRTRLLVGTLLALAAVGLLFLDTFLRPYDPGLLILALGVGALACWELHDLLPAGSRPRTWVLPVAVLPMLASGWLGLRPGDLLAAAALAAFAVELYRYSGPGPATGRVAHTVFAAAYLGLLPTYLLELRRLPGDMAGTALALAVFVPKCGDIGAYFAGRLFGRTPMAPRLSPKKTWEGFCGGILLAVGVAVLLGRQAPVFGRGWPEAVLFGALVGAAGVVGDLAESLVKRDAQAKDASGRVPGFGGVLDVIDSVVFAAPVSYFLLTR